MASLGVLASLMQNLSPQVGVPQWNPVEEAQQQERLKGRRTDNETALLTLFDLKQRQASEQEVLAAIQKDPRIAQMLLGGSTIGSLGTAPPPGAPGAAPMTQQTLMPGQPPGAPQTVPGGQDLSQFAQQGGPQQSTIASLGPAGQFQMQPQRNPVLEMAARDPRAAMLLQQQIEQRQEQRWKTEERRLDMGVKIAEAVAQELTGVRDQPSLDAARARVQQYHPQAAAQIPQMYSKEGIEQLQQRGVAVADRAKNAKLDAESRHIEMKTKLFPELVQRLGMDEEAQAPADGGASATTAPGATGTAARSAPPEYESAITEANRLYPQISTARIKSIIAAESNFDAKAVSSAGAKGLMQLMDATAKDMGVDDPFDVQQNVRGGTRYYAQMLSRYAGDERKALVAYNWGPGNLDKVGGDVSKAPPETQAYVAKVLGGGGGGGAGSGTAQAGPTDPRIAELDAKIARRTRDAKLAALMGEEALSTRHNDDAKRLADDKNRLLEEIRRQQERAEEIPRAAQKQTAELEATQQFERQRQAGPLLPEDRRKHLVGLRENVLKEPTFKTYQDVRNGYQNVKVGAASDSAQGDLAIFNGLAKILDPTSSVMSGEAKNIEDAQGQLQIWFNSPAKFLEGDRISSENRPRFLKMAHDLAKEKLTAAQTELKTVWGPMAQEVGIDFNQVVPLPDLTPLEPGPNVSKLDALIKKK